ncbi:MAG: M20/M25/M40 family metallo-hydrolase [Anaerolineales bacterium]|nr:M20/M25/M40 family metallo-hydrolase [Anaerolineales bacterium]
MRSSLEKALEYLDSSQEQFYRDLDTFLRFPSIAVEPARAGDISRTVEWLSRRVQAAGFEKVEALETGGFPVILAELGSKSEDMPCVLIYGHYDVQSPAPEEAWTSPPFDPTRSGEYLVARGAADMKGQLMACLAAIEAWNQVDKCPVNIKLLIEGEEELGSPHLGKLVFDQRERLQADVGLNLDAGMAARDVPTITTALRGAMLFELKIQGSERDLHSGIFGGLVENPIQILCRILSGLQDEAGIITLPGLYDRVRFIKPEERAGMEYPAEALLRQVGAASLRGDQEYSAFERTTIRPSFDVLHIYGGARKTAIPSEAGASISMRIVPDQDPDEVYEKLKEYLAAVVPEGVKWNLSWKVGVPPVLSDPEFIGNQAMAQAMKAVWGVDPAFLPGGGTIPVVPMLYEILGIQSLLTGFSLPDDNMHGPDERIHLPTLEKGKRVLVHFFNQLACE